MRLTLKVGFGLAFATLAAMAACSGGAGVPFPEGTGGAQSSSPAAGTGGDVFSSTSSGGCMPGDACEGGTCTDGGVCCVAAKVCGSSCCGDGDVCSFQKCVKPGAPCVESEDCAKGEYCDPTLGEDGAGGGGGGPDCQSGAATPSGRCLPEPPACGPNEAPGEPPTCLIPCEYKPPAASFDPVLAYAWGGQVTPPYATDVMMTPIVVQLDDDDCDGKITERDIPEIVFSTFTGGKYYGQGTLHAVSIVGGTVVEKWSVPNAVQASGGLAAGDLDGDGVPEIVACAAPAPGGKNCCDAQAWNTGVVAFDASGKVKWTQPDTTQVHCGYEYPAIADPKQSGSPMVLVGFALLDGKSGAIVKNLVPSVGFGSRLSSFADLDGDGALDVTDGQRAYRIDGTKLWDLASGPDALSAGYHAVGDLDKDGKPEVVIVSSSAPHAAHVIRHDPLSASGVKVVRKGVDINNGTSTAAYCGVGSEYGGGPPTVADFNGDGTPDVGAAGAVGYIVLDGKKLVDSAIPNGQTALWFKTTKDCSSAVTGSAVFDFNGDGKAEVVYSDELHLWMYDGSTGQNLIPTTCNTTGTLWEYPVVADVDNDGQADIVVASNAYASTCPEGGTKQAGIRVYSSASSSWVRTRRVWNQHTYHITNVDERGGIPKQEVANWLAPGLNDFRLNKQPGSEFAAPDLVVSVTPRCAGDYALVARVTNLGEASVPAGVPVGLYLGAPADGMKLGALATTTALFPLGSEELVFSFADIPAGPVVARVDDGMPKHSWVECRPDNNDSPPTSAKCDEPK
ncbi:MAG: VCBS repeat-containing protein [Deltaproteobacteria bacterium]|nr:VCBS repeat-containing protein [Deltaproteobacteria bacterium]